MPAAANGSPPAGSIALAGRFSSRCWTAPAGAPAGIRPGADFLAVDCQDAVAGQQAGPGSRRVHRGLSDDGLRFIRAGHVQAGIQEDRKDQVENGTRGDDGDTLADGLVVEGAGHLGGRGARRGIVLHLDVAAQRQGGNRPLRAVAIRAAQDDLADAHRKTQHFHPAQAGYPASRVKSSGIGI
ncbi:hypothetical protein G6F57_019557 [Rhizopus arrhizus]|nr:hypothetical protein G6F57_019557 [Rhizopus arrhizus]